MGKKVAAAPLAVKKVEVKKEVNPLFEKRPRNFGIGKCLLLVSFCILLLKSQPWGWGSNCTEMMINLKTDFFVMILQKFELFNPDMFPTLPAVTFFLEFFYEWYPIFQDKMFNPPVTFPGLSSGLNTLGSKGRRLSCRKDWRCPHQSTNSLRLWISKQVSKM